MLLRRKAHGRRVAVAMLGVAVCLGLGFVAAPEAAGQAAAEPDRAANAPGNPDGAPKAAPVQVTVVAVSGVAQKRAMGDPAGKWQPVKVGDVLGEQTVIRTGLGTEVVLLLADRGRVVVRSGTKAGIGTFRKKGKVLTARLGLKYGTLRAHVDGAPGPNDLQVATPVATVSVRGCGANMGIDERGFRFGVFEHQWEVRTRDGRKKMVREKECTDGALKPWRKLLTELGYVCVAGVGQDEDDQDSLMENADGRAILDNSAGDNGRWLFGFPTGSQGNGPSESMPPVYNQDRSGGTPRR